jgi:hypothetical protein
VPFQFTIDHARKFVDVRGSGEIVLQDILAYFDALVVEGGMPYPKLIDMRDVVPKISDDEMMTLGARVSAYANFEPRGPIAVVSNTPESEILVRRFMNLGGAGVAGRRSPRLDSISLSPARRSSVGGEQVGAAAQAQQAGRDAAVFRALIDHAEQAAGPRQRRTEARLVALEGIEAAAQHERQLVEQHLAGGAQFARVAQPAAQGAGLAVGAAVGEFREMQHDQLQPAEMRNEPVEPVRVGERYRLCRRLHPLCERQRGRSVVGDRRHGAFPIQRHRRAP